MKCFKLLTTTKNLNTMTTTYRATAFIGVLLLTLSACSDFIDIDAPRTDLVRKGVFDNPESATAATTELYQQMHRSGFASGDLFSISALTSLSADDLTNGASFSNQLQQFNDNTLLPANTNVLSLWSEMYQCIYKANAIIEGVNNSTKLETTLKTQLIGEVKFVRAFCYFYLVNLYGDVPLATSTDYTANQNLPRTASTKVYSQIIEDLTVAKANLPDDFNASGGERIRPNKYAALTLLARTHLFMQNWTEAEAAASLIIAKSEWFQLTTLPEVFLANSTEAIWQLQPLEGNAQETATFFFYGHQLTQELLNAFEPTDNRRSAWVGFGEWGDYYYPNKYKAINYDYSEYSTVFRLAEVYLIRAEAQARQNKLAQATDDLNTIRTRAGLTEINPANTNDMIEAIMQERRVELFTEWGHRWIDLKRIGTLNNILGAMKPLWKPSAALYPIPESQILNAPAMMNAQNPGY